MSCGENGSPTPPLRQIHLPALIERTAGLDARLEDEFAGRLFDSSDVIDDDRMQWQPHRLGRFAGREQERSLLQIQIREADGENVALPQAGEVGDDEPGLPPKGGRSAPLRGLHLFAGDVEPGKILLVDSPRQSTNHFGRLHVRDPGDDPEAVGIVVIAGPDASQDGADGSRVPLTLGRVRRQERLAEVFQDRLVDFTDGRIVGPRSQRFRSYRVFSTERSASSSFG